MNAVFYRLLSLFVAGVLAVSPLATVYAASEQDEQQEIVPYGEEAIGSGEEQSGQEDQSGEPENPEAGEREQAETVEAPDSDN